MIRLTTDYAWDLSLKKFVNGVVYKTHGLANELPKNSNLKVIFIFGSASDSALSVYGCMEKKSRQWVEDHFNHMRANG